MASHNLPTPPDRPSEAATEVQKKDGWENTITALGTARDKQSGTRIKVTPFTASRDEFDEMYSGDDTSATIAELPPREMTRQWITMSVDDSVDDQGRTEEDSTQEKMLTAKNVMQALDDLEVKSFFSEGLTWARVHGGSLVFMGVNDGVEDLTEPLNLDAVKSLDFLLVFDRWEVRVQSTEDDLKNKNFGKPKTYLMQTSTETGLPTKETVEIHASRFIRFDGVKTTRYRKARNNGWSDSVYVRMKETLQNYGISWVGITHMLQTANQAVLKMKGLSDAICESESTLVLDRMTAMDLCRSIARMIPIDAEDEDFMNIATSFAGVPETIDRTMLRVSSAARIPATLLFGQSPAGLNATGESDIRFFYDQIKAMQEDILRPAIGRLLEVIFASKKGPTKGIEPENWSFEFNPLWQITDKEESEIKKNTADTDAVYIANGVLSEDEVAMSRFGGDTYSTETVLDMEVRNAEPEEGEEAVDPAAIAAFAANAAAPAPGQPGGPQMPPGQVVRLMHADSVEKRGAKYAVLSRSGEVLAEHDTEEEAKKQLAAVEAAKDRTDRFSMGPFLMTNEVNRHSHMLDDLPAGDIPPGEYKTALRGGHLHVVSIEKTITVGEKATLTTSGEDGHKHSIVIEPVVA